MVNEKPILLNALGINQNFNELVVLKDIDLTLRSNEILCILGGSGSGKTTLMSILSGLLKPKAGKIHIDGHEVYEGSNFQEKRLKIIGMVFQNFALFNHLTVLENLITTHWFLEPDVDKCTKIASELLQRYGLANHASKYPDQLSSGEKQRLGIARALINDPKIIFADEPTGSVDPSNSERIMKIFKTLSDNNRGIIYSTHDLNNAGFADRILMLKDHGLKQIDADSLKGKKSVFDLYSTAL